MTTDRFDTISRMFSQRLTRRTALRGSGAGLAGAALASTAAVAAQDATPADDDDTVHPRAGGEDITYLFTQAFERGAWEPKAGEEDIYTLTLTGASAQTIYFSDRPDRIFGLAPTQQFLDNLGFSPGNPPNAALVAPIADSDEEEILIIELLNPRYDASTATLTYDAWVLADYHEDGLSHAATRQQDYQFPATFDRGGLFIDSACGESYICRNEDGDNVGTISIEQCFNRFQLRCFECHDADSRCGDEFPDACTNADGDDVCEAEKQ